MCQCYGRLWSCDSGLELFDRLATSHSIYPDVLGKPSLSFSLTFPFQRAHACMIGVGCSIVGNGLFEEVSTLSKHASYWR